MAPKKRPADEARSRLEVKLADVRAKKAELYALIDAIADQVWIIEFGICKLGEKLFSTEIEASQ